MSKERAARRAQREADQAVARAQREKRQARGRRAEARRESVAAPARGAGAWVRARSRSFGRRTRGQRIVIAAAVLVLLGGAVFASSWSMRLLVLGFTVLLFPVAWTLVSGRR